MTKRFAVTLLVLLLASPAVAGAPPVTLYDIGNQPLGDAAHPFAANSAPFSTVTPFTVGGAAVASGRATAANCTASGTVTYTLSSGTSYTVPVVVGWNSYPFAVTGASAATATCTYANMS